MNESNRKNPAKEQKTERTRTSASKASTVVANHTDNVDQTNKSTMPESDASANDANSMRIILPVFIENEQKYAQMERRRKIQSSPAKSMRRFSQDSSKTDQPHYVCILIN